MVSEVKKRGKSKKDDEVSKTGKASSADGTQPAVSPQQSAASEDTQTPLRYGSMPTFSGQRLWSRSALILGLMAVVYFNSGVKESSFGKVGETIPGKAFETKCSARMETELNQFEGCKSSKCGRVLTDSLFTVQELFGVTDLGLRVFTAAAEESGFYDLFSGKLLQDKESNLVELNTSGDRKIFKSVDNQIFQIVESKVRRLIAEHFKIDYWKIRLGTAFYTHITPSGKKKDHMTKPIVHQDTFSSQFSAIVYLTDFGKDFAGGRLVFPDSDSTNRTVEARKGRVVAFTSGLENQHVTEPVTKGRQETLVMAFTCDPKKKVGEIKIS